MSLSYETIYFNYAGKVFLGWQWSVSVVGKVMGSSLHALISTE